MSPKAMSTFNALMLVFKYNIQLKDMRFGPEEIKGEPETFCCIRDQRYVQIINRTHWKDAGDYLKGLPLVKFRTNSTL